MFLHQLQGAKLLYGLSATLAVPALALTGVGLVQMNRTATPSEPVSAAVETPQAGQWVYLDENGNRIARPAGAAVPAPAAKEQSDAPFPGKSAAGGIGVRNPYVSYTYAVRDAEGNVGVQCATVDRSEAEAGTANLAHACSSTCEHAVAGEEQDHE